MTGHDSLHSWRVLLDCLAALDMLASAVDDPDRRKEVPVLWVGSVSMLRAIGHVLEKVDAKNSLDVDKLVKKAWPIWKRDPLFQKLEQSRNDTLKTYEFGWDHVVVPVWSGPYKRPEDAPSSKHYGFLMFRDMPEDGVGVLREAHHWWMDRIGALGHLVGTEPLSNREKMEDRFLALR